MTTETPNMPDLTLVQKLTALVLGLPALATFLTSFGLFNLTEHQVSSLQDLLLILVIPAAVMIFSDFGIRKARNDRLAQENSGSTFSTVINEAEPLGSGHIEVKVDSTLDDDVTKIRQEQLPGFGDLRS